MSETSTKIMIISSKRTGQIRRIIFEDVDEGYIHHENTLHPGENMLYITREEFSTLNGDIQSFKHHVAKQHGFLEAPDDRLSRLAHIDPDGNVINVIHGDLSCGDHVDWYGENHFLKHHPFVEKGWIHTEDNELLKDKKK